MAPTRRVDREGDRPTAPGEARTNVRVRYPETDRMDVAYHAHYLVWFELGRTELMRELGCPYGELEDRRRLRFPVLAVGARFHSPARYDDPLTVCTRISEVGGARLRFEYRVLRRGEERPIAVGFTEHAAVGEDGRVRRLPPDLRDRLRSGAGPC
jgi:acyl-CoA thioester hydrolase